VGRGRSGCNSIVGGDLFGVVLKRSCGGQKGKISTQRFRAGQARTD